MLSSLIGTSIGVVFGFGVFANTFTNYNFGGSTLLNRFTVKVNLDKGIYPENDNTSLIDRLQEGESFTINLTSMGCSHFRKDSLMLYYRDGSIRAYNGVKDKSLSQKQIKAVRVFEFQAKLIKDGGCTTTDHYRISYKDEVLEFTDNTCKWEGLKLLSKVLFGEENKVNEI